MEQLPRGANFKRARLLWEIGLHIGGDPATPYYGNRDICIVVGSGSAQNFSPWLRMSTGSPILAHAVARGELEMAMVNPSGLLTQAYRGTGLFQEPLPVRVVANYPSWDRFVCVIHPRTGLTSLAQIKERRYPLRLSIREDPTHSTRVLIDQTMAAYGFTLSDIESWGGSLQLNGGPGDERRMKALHAEEIDAIFDEGLVAWFDEALAAGMIPLTLEDPVFQQLMALGWRRVVIPAGRFPHLKSEHACLDYSGWPLYTRASLPDEDVYKVCAAIQARESEIFWEDSYTGIGQLGQETDATPLDVPLHPGAAQWYREQGFKV
ncbi:MAG: TAXI family TRAP transporter solute-binding subunit [Candidatus Binatia bacterium]